MKRNLLILFLIGLFSFSQPACNMNKWLDVHRMEVLRLSDPSLSQQEKFDGLATLIASVLEQSLKFINPANSYKFVNSFLDQNEKELNLLYTDLNHWQQNMNTAEKITFGAKSAKKPYVKSLIDVIPKFRDKVERQVKTIVFLGKLLKLFNPLKILS